MVNITGRCLRHLGIRLPRQSVLAIDSRSEDCAKHVRVYAGQPVWDSDGVWGGHPSSSS